MTLALEYLNHSKNEFHVMVFNRSPYGELMNEIEATGAKVYFIPNYIKSIPQRLWFLYQWIKIINPSVIHSWTIHDNAYASLLGKILGIPKIIGSVRGSLTGTGFKSLSPLKKWVSLHWTDILIVNAKAIFQELKCKNIPIKKIIYIRNGIEKSSGPKQDCSDTNPIICTIGNLRKNKNHSLFIRIMKKVISQIPNAEGWIIGQPVDDEPHQKSKLESEIKSYNLEEKVKLMGFKSDIKSLLKESSVFVLPSISEGHPNTILEAMAEGVPVVASNVGGIPEIIQDGENGYLLKHTDEHGFVETIVRLLNISNIWHRISQNGLSKIETQYNSFLIKKQLNDLYHGAML